MLISQLVPWITQIQQALADGDLSKAHEKNQVIRKTLDIIAGSTPDFDIAPLVTFYERTLRPEDRADLKRSLPEFTEIWIQRIQDRIRTPEHGLSVDQILKIKITIDQMESKLETTGCSAPA